MGTKGKFILLFIILIGIIGTVALLNRINQRPVVITSAPNRVVKLNLYTHTWQNDPPRLDADMVRDKLEAVGYKVVVGKTKKADLTLKIEYEEELGYEIKPYGMGTNVNFAFWLFEPDGTEIFSDRTLIRQPEKSKHPTEESLAAFANSSFYAVFGEYVYAVLEDDIEPLVTLMDTKTWPIQIGRPDTRLGAAAALGGIESPQARAILKERLKQDGDSPVAQIIKATLGLEYQ